MCSMIGTDGCLTLFANAARPRIADSCVEFWSSIMDRQFIMIVF